MDYKYPRHFYDEKLLKTMAIATYIAHFFNPSDLILLYKSASVDESHSVLFNPDDKEAKVRDLISMRVK